MKFSRVAGLCAGLLLAVSPVTLAAQTAATGQNVAVDGGRALHVLVAQTEIKSDINLSNVAVATGGGLLGGLIGAAVDSARAKKAEALIAPVREAMTGFDTEALAIEAAKGGFAGAEWFKANPVASFGKDSSSLGKSNALDTGKTGQIAFVEYTYDLSPDFSAARVVAKIEVANRAIPASAKGKPEKRLSPKNLAYVGNVTSIVALPSASTEKEANAALWAADNAKLTRAALTMAFEQVKLLTPRAIALTDADIKALNNKANKKVGAGGFIGRPQPSADGTVLLWTGTGFVHSQQFP